MSWIENGLLLCGFVILIVGYRRNHRRLLVAGAITLVLGAGLSDIVTGVHDGWNAACASPESAAIAPGQP